MQLPDYQTLMLPTLKSVSKKDIATVHDVLKDIQKEFDLTNNQMIELLPSGSEPIIKNRVSWAMFYLMKASLLDRPQRGKFRVAELGRKILSNTPERIDNAFLKQFPTFQKFIENSQKPKDKNKNIINETTAEDPIELLEQNYERYKASVCTELLSMISTIEPREFEILVLELLKKMGYGSDILGESVRHTGKSGDGGVDGEIFQDTLGLEKIYVQAKRYQESTAVSREELQKFVGSLSERKSNKGIFITTSYFANTVDEYLKKIDVSISLIDGNKLSEYMYNYNIGVSLKNIFEIKKIDHDYFEE